MNRKLKNNRIGMSKALTIRHCEGESPKQSTDDKRSGLLHSARNAVDACRHKVTAHDIVKFLLRYADTIDISGLFNGKAGLSLALFVAADHLRDEQLQDTAFHFLKEVLVSKNNDFGFENGLSGIGYTLLYLIEHKFLETDYDEIFRTQHKDILNHYEQIATNPSLLLTNQTIIYFLSKLADLKDDPRIKMIIQKIFEGIELFLTIQFNDYIDFHYVGVKTDVAAIYKTYLKLVDYAGYADFSHSVLEDYIVLCRQGKIISSLETGIYLKKITEKHHIRGYEYIINDHISNGLKNLHPQTLTLKEKIDLELLMQHPANQIKAVEIPLEIVSKRKDDALRNVMKTIELSNPLGYGAGLARLLIYYTDKNIELL